MKQLAKVVIVLLGLGLGVLASYASRAEGEVIIYQAPILEEKPKEIRIEVKYTKEGIEKKIKQEFFDAPIMVEVARCESQFKIGALNSKLNKDGTTDGGIFQLNSIHDEELKELGLDKWDLEDNIKFARILYERRGLQPWESSRHCWGKYTAS